MKGKDCYLCESGYRRGAVSLELPSLPCTPAREAAMSNATWKDLYDAAMVEFDLKKLPERVEAAHQAIRQYLIQKGRTLSAEERDEIDDALRTLVTLIQRRAA